MKSLLTYRFAALGLMVVFLTLGCNEANAPTEIAETPAFAKLGTADPVGGNDVVPRAVVDAWDNFSLVDLNNHFDVDGTITHWEVYTGVRSAPAPDNGTEPVQLVIYRLDTGVWSIVGTSDLETPVLGFNQFILSEPIEVQQGDFIGLVNSSVMFTSIVQGGNPSESTVCYGSGWNGGAVTPDGEIVPENEIVCTGDQRVYSVRAYGDRVTICHKPGTPKQKDKVIPIQAWAGHKGHGDTWGFCGGSIL